MNSDPQLSNPSTSFNATDTDPQYWVILRNLGLAGRARLTFDLSASLRRITEDGVRHRHPDYTDRQVRLAATKLALGQVLFRRVYPNEDVEP